MSTDVEWPEFCPRLELTINVASGTLSLGTSTLVNYADFVWGPPNQVTAGLWRNGTKVADITINPSNGVLSMSSISVSTSDHIEVRFVADGYAATPWKTTLVICRSAFFDVPAGTSTTTFDGTTNPMPVPTWDHAFGWDGSEHLKLGFAASSDDGASQDMVAYTRRGGGLSETSSVIDLDTATTQTHTSSFVKSDVTGTCEAELVLKSGTGATRSEVAIRLVFTDKTAVPGYPGTFPASGVLLRHVKDTSRGKLLRP